MSLRKAGTSDLNSIINIEKTSYKKPYWNESLLKYLFNNSITDSAWILEVKKKISAQIQEIRGVTLLHARIGWIIFCISH